MAVRKLFSVVMIDNRTKEEQELEVMAKNAKEASEKACMQTNWNWEVKAITQVNE